MPKYNALFLPTLQAINDLGGSGSISEIVSTVSRNEGYSDEQQEVLHNDGPVTEIGYRLAWARTYLKFFGLITNSSRGVWSLTDDGVRFLAEPNVTNQQRDRRLQEMKNEQIRKAAAERAARRDTASGQERMPMEGYGADVDINDEDPEAGTTAEESEGVRWKERLVATLTAEEFTPAQFERLAQRLLREADFESVTVTGRSGDQGIDGVGIYRLGLLTFPVFFQCKRYARTVGPGEVRDFRGAMQGRGEKGLLITTGSFTAAAKQEANRDGATPIDLIDGDRLCNLLQRYELGVRTVIRQVEDVTIDAGFFADI